MPRTQRKKKHLGNSKRKGRGIEEDELKEENAKLKTELAACQAKLLETERLCGTEATSNAAAEKQLAQGVADFAKKSEVKTVKARN